MDQSKNLNALKQAQEYYQEHLPFFVRSDFNSCHAHKFYEWQRDFMLNRKLLAFLTAANQIGKSSIQIIRCLNQASRQDLWPYFFPKIEPKSFLYLYPESKLATQEWHEKWVKEYMARGKMKDDPRFGWKENYEKKMIESVKFASGVTLYFRHYSQSPHSLQASTADAVFLDEETPEAHYDELMVRTQARQAVGSGYVSMCFTATLGQLYLYQCMEMQGLPEETFKNAWKRQVSAFDCLRYCDGTASTVWTKAYIEQELMPKYRSEAEIQKRIYGRFIKTSGLLHPDFELQYNSEQVGDTDTTGWSTYCGIDFGAGGEWGHSSGIVLVKVDPSYVHARVVKSWCSKKQRMTQADLLVQYQVITSGMGDVICYADWAATDFFEFAGREGVPINRAEKSHEIGINLLNMIIRERQLKILVGDGTGDNDFLVQEIQSIGADTVKRKRRDDLADALRYAVSLCPLRITGLVGAKQTIAKAIPIDPRLAFYRGLDNRADDPMMRLDEDTLQDIDYVHSLFEGLP
jgi:phage terminase large subunit-like protein